jgi:hypothetical protein
MYMDLSYLPLQLQNDIIMLQRPQYPFINDIEDAYDYRLFKKIIQKEMLEIAWERFYVVDIGYNFL